MTCSTMGFIATIHNATQGCIFCYAKWHYSEYHYAERRYVKCLSDCSYAECHYVECHYAECRYAALRRNVVMPSALISNFITPSVVLLRVTAPTWWQTKWSISPPLKFSSLFQTLLNRQKIDQPCKTFYDCKLCCSIVFTTSTHSHPRFTFAGKGHRTLNFQMAAYLTSNR